MLTTSMSQGHISRHKSKQNFTTLGYHKGMNNSSYFKAMLSSHLLASSADNHVLKCASTSYSKGFRSRSLKSPSIKGKSQNPQFFGEQTAFYDECSGKDQQEARVNNLFTMKLEKKPKIDNELKHEVEEKKSLQKYIAQLKKGINNENKKIIKTELSCDHMKNTIQLTKKETDRVREINRNLAVQIEKICIELNDGQTEYKRIKENIAWTKRRIEDEKKLKSELRQFNIKCQIELRKQNKQFSAIKDTEIRDIRKMVGSHAYKVQLEEEKALLLNQIDSNYSKNSKGTK